MAMSSYVISSYVNVPRLSVSNREQGGRYTIADLSATLDGRQRQSITVEVVETHVKKEVQCKMPGGSAPDSVGIPDTITMTDIASPLNLRAAVAMVRKNAQNLKPPARGRLRDFCSRLDTATMQQLLMGGHYVPQPYKQEKHQNKEGKVRILGIPSHSDRVVQMALKLVLEPVCEAQLFRDESYAFRPDRAVKDAISAVWEHHENGRVWTAKADIHSFFDSINHARMLEVVNKRLGVSDEVIKLIGAMLKAGKLHNGLLYPTEQGIPQGGVFSPLLANVYGTLVDERLAEADISFVRYADDILLMAYSEEETHAQNTLLARVAGELALTLNEDKSSIALLEDTSYLGVGFDQYGVTIPHTRVVRKAGYMLEIFQTYEGNEALDKIRESLKGWFQYYHSINRRLTEGAMVESVINTLSCRLPPQCQPVILEALNGVTGDGIGIGHTA